MADMATMPVADLAEELKKTAQEMLDKNDFVRGMVFNLIANRFKECVDRIEELEGGMQTLTKWIDAYPLEVFPEPDFKKAHEVLKENGMGIDAISASNMRHVLNGVKKIIDPLHREST